MYFYDKELGLSFKVRDSKTNFEFWGQSNNFSEFRNEYQLYKKSVHCLKIT